MTKKILIILGIIFLVAIFASGPWWLWYLHKAHSTFENYYSFRGCVKLIEKTDTSGICKIGSGQTIKIVRYQGKWFLAGDLPGDGLF